MYILVKLENVQRNAGDVITNINKSHTSGFLEHDIPSGHFHRLKESYRNGITLSLNEIKIINDIIEKVSVLMALRDASEYNVIDGKRKKRKQEVDDKVPLNGLSTPSTTPTPTSTSTAIPINATTTTPSKKVKIHIFPTGTLVAARQPPQKDARNDEWILARVLQFHADKNKYHVEDVDHDEYGQTQRYMLSSRQVIPIPDSSYRGPEYPSGRHVLALYPGTTCFYKAIVVTPPSKNKDSDTMGMYKVQFEDDNNEIKFATPEHVLETPKISK
ncbi:unnamed protein product [Absidia cylindrospora]